ncbi:MAG: hypothetical protein K2X77_20035 [Candidatus Obscuribacterales bacterium]|nr:hypothetical protein [Candidatus Obscuribacterales bacterium]
MFPIIFRVLTFAGAVVVAGLATRAVILRRQREEEAALLNLGDPQRSPQQAADRQPTPKSAEHQSGNGGDKSYMAKGTGNAFFKPEPSPNPRSNDQKTDTPKEIAQLTDEGMATAAKSAAAAAKSSEKSSASENLAPMPEKTVSSAPLPSKDIGHAKGQELAESPSEEQLKFSADLSHKFEQIDALVEKSEPELDGPYCRPATLKVYMDALETVRNMKENKSKLETSGTADQWKGVLSEADRILSDLHANWQQLMADQQAGERASSVITSSEHVLSSYKAPDGLKVDLSLAKFSLETAERSMQEHRYDDAFEKAGAVGMLVGMAEVRAGIDSELKELSKNEELKAKTDAVRQTLREADAFLSDASKSFMSDQPPDGEYVIKLQNAFQKTTQAQQELMKAKV